MSPLQASDLKENMRICSYSHVFTTEKGFLRGRVPLTKQVSRLTTDECGKAFAAGEVRCGAVGVIRCNEVWCSGSAVGVIRLDVVRCGAVR